MWIVVIVGHEVVKGKTTGAVNVSVAMDALSNLGGMVKVTSTS